MNSKGLSFLQASSKDFEQRCMSKQEFLNPGFALVKYFRFFYYTALCPFKFTFNEQTRRYNIHTNILQQGCCVVMNVCVVLNLFSYLRFYAGGGARVPSTEAKKTELLYFSIGLSFGELVLGMSYLVTSWFYANEFQTLINYYYNQLTTFNIRRTNFNKHAGGMVTVLYGIAMIACGVVTVGYNLEEIWHLHYEDIHYLLFLDLIPFISFNSDTARMIKILILICTELQYFAVYVASQSLIITAAMVIMTLLGEMQRKLQHRSVHEGIDYYGRLKHVCGLHDTALNLATFGGVFGQILALAFSVPSIFQPETPFTFLINLMHGTVGMGYLTIASLVVTKSTAIFEDWLILGRKFEEMSENQVAVFLYSMSQREISITTLGLVKLTPDFLGAILGLVFTFSIVIIQFNQTKSSAPTGNCTCPAAP